MTDTELCALIVLLRKSNHLPPIQAYDLAELLEELLLRRGPITSALQII